MKKHHKNRFETWIDRQGSLQTKDKEHTEIANTLLGMASLDGVT